MKNKLLKSLFSSGLQAIAVQILGALFFFVIPFYISKSDFGIVNWANAVALMLTSLLSFGMEQVVFRRIAASERSDWAAAAFLIHAFLGSVITFLVLFLSSSYLGKEGASYLPWFFLAQSFIYIALPLKQLLNAKQKFAPYGVIAVFTNALKLAIILFLAKRGSIDINHVWLTMLICALIEFTALLIYVRRTGGFNMYFKITAYVKLIRESLPQYMSAIFDSSLARLDWILLGIISTNVATAEYSVAYKGFELAKLPIAIIAPVILARFSKMMVYGKMDDQKVKLISDIFRIEMFLAVLLCLILNILWAPVLDYIYKGEYGSNNSYEFLLLSLGLPLQFGINLFWTICFTGRQYRKVANITILSATVNLVLNLSLIPFFGGMGAATSFLLTSIIQIGSYWLLVRKSSMTVPIFSVIPYLLIAAGIYVLVEAFIPGFLLQIPVAVLLYILICSLTKHIDRGQVQVLQSFIKK